MAAEHAFEIDSNVGRYWLANGEGFDVVVERGRRLGVVEDVVVNPLTHEVSSVVVRRRFPVSARRSARVAIGDLTAVLPASRRFLVTARAEQRAARARGALTAAGSWAGANWPSVRRALGAAVARAGDALAACVAVSAAVAEWSWQTAREHLRESGVAARSRVR